MTPLMRVSAMRYLLHNPSYTEESFKHILNGSIVKGA